jgi:hypothetical protein
VEEFSAFIVVVETYRFLGRSFGAFLRRGLMTLLCAAIAIFLALYDIELNLPPEVLQAAIAGFAGLSLLFAVHFVIGWHRYALGPEVEETQVWRYTVTYIRATLVIAALVVIPLAGALTAAAVLGPAVSLPAAVLGVFLIATVIGKFALAWPAAAMGRRHVLRHGWVMSSGLVPQLVLTVLLTSGPFDAAAGGLLYASAELPPAFLGPLAFGAALMVLLGMTAGATALSFAYRWRLRQDNSHWWRHAG